MKRSQANNESGLRLTATRLALLFASCAFALSACNPATESPEQAAQTPAAETPVSAAPTAPATAASTAEAVVDSEETTPTEQVSEAEESTDPAVDAAAASATPALKLASTATQSKPVALSVFKEGVHYQRLSPTQPTNAAPGEVEVVEVFWYGCPHCFALDPKLEAWRIASGEKSKPNYVVFRRIPAVWNDITLFHARVFYTAELLGKLDQVHTPIFREINVNGNPLNTMAKTKSFFVAQGVAAADFDRTFASFALEAKLQNANVLNRRYRVPSVPFFVINGKYTANVTSAGGEEQLVQLITELAVREHGG